MDFPYRLGYVRYKQKKMDSFYLDTRDDACGIFMRVQRDVTGKQTLATA